MIRLTSTPGVFLQFIPFSGGAHVAMDLPFVIMGFPDPDDLDIVCMGYQTGVLWIEDISEVHGTTCASTYCRLQRCHSTNP